MRLSDKIIRWFDGEQRILPWRLTKDPYRTLIAGILLRKTTAKQVSSIYDVFLKKFPTPTTLAQADIHELEKTLRPLGIYKVRATQLKTMASSLVSNHQGKIPDTYDHLVELPGVSRYIANSVLCFAYRKKVAIVDTNIIRIYRRLTNDRELRIKDVWDLNQQHLPELNVAEYNWGLLDLAAKVCRPKYPRCEHCPICYKCKYYRTNAGAPGTL